MYICIQCLCRSAWAYVYVHMCTYMYLLIYNKIYGICTHIYKNNNKCLITIIFFFQNLCLSNYTINIWTYQEKSNSFQIVLLFYFVAVFCFSVEFCMGVDSCVPYSIDSIYTNRASCRHLGSSWLGYRTLHWTRSVSVSVSVSLSFSFTVSFSVQLESVESLHESHCSVHCLANLTPFLSLPPRVRLSLSLLSIFRPVALRGANCVCRRF